MTEQPRRTKTVVLQELRKEQEKILRIQQTDLDEYYEKLSGTIDDIAQRCHIPVMVLMNSATRLSSSRNMTFEQALYLINEVQVTLARFEKNPE